MAKSGPACAPLPPDIVPLGEREGAVCARLSFLLIRRTNSVPTFVLVQSGQLRALLQHSI